MRSPSVGRSSGESGLKRNANENDAPTGPSIIGAEMSSSSVIDFLSLLRAR